MAETTVKGKAPWLLGEITPILITFALGAGSLVLGLTNAFNLTGGIIGAVIGIGLALFLVYVNAGRKKKSTLVAELKNDRKYGIKVWMVKPNKVKWNGKLDATGKNSANLVGGYRVTLDDVQGTKTLVFHVAKGRQFLIPVRFFRDNTQVATYFAEARNLSNWKTTPEAEAIFKEFLPVVSKTEGVVEEENEDPAIVFEDEETNAVDYEDWDEEEVYGQKAGLEVPDREYRVTQFITYPDLPEDKTVGEQVTDQLDAHERKAIEDIEKELATPTPDIFGLDGKGKSSITIDLGDTK